MPKFKATATMTTYLELELEAENEEEAFKLALQADGGSFTECPRTGDWNVDGVYEVRP